MCSSGSKLCQRDTKPNLNLMDNVRHKHGDMQDLIMFAKSTNFSVRLVVLDYAGLSTDPMDIRKFVRELESIKELVVYHGTQIRINTTTKRSSWKSYQQI